MFPAEIVVTGGGVNRAFAEGDKGAVEKSIHAGGVASGGQAVSRGAGGGGTLNQFRFRQISGVASNRRSFQFSVFQFSVVPRRGRKVEAGRGEQASPPVRHPASRRVPENRLSPEHWLFPEHRLSRENRLSPIPRPLVRKRGQGIFRRGGGLTDGGGGYKIGAL